AGSAVVPPSPRPALVAMRPGSGPPVVWVHPGGGGILCYAGLARHLDGGRPLYGVQARGLDGEAPPRDDLAAMAASYVAGLRALQPAGPYRLAGWSLGGLIAWEMACRLRQAGEEIHPLILVDAHLPGPVLDPRQLGTRQLVAGLALQLGLAPGVAAAAA